MRVIVLGAATLPLAACSTPEERAARQQQIDMADHQECVELGLKPKTEAYADCRLRVREMRQRERAIQQDRYGVGFGWGHGPFHNSHGYRFWGRPY